MPEDRGTVAIDFDGVLNEYPGWLTDLGRTRQPVPGARAFVQRLLAEGFRVVIFTCRDYREVRAWLAHYGFPEGALHVTDKKPVAMCYIDDRGYRFEGDWDAAYAAITQAPWWGRGLWVPSEEPREVKQ
jgi:hypothetical protein